MAQGSRLRTTLLHGTVLLCVPLLLSLPQADAQAAEAAGSAATPVYNSNMNAYRARRIKSRAESYQQRKQFPPVQEDGTAAETLPEQSEIKHAQPLKVTIPNVAAAPSADSRGTQIVTRSSPAYKQLASPQQGSSEMQPISEQLSEAGQAVTSAIGDAGRSLLSVVMPSQPATEVTDDVPVALPSTSLAAQEMPAAVAAAENLPAPSAPEQAQDSAKQQPKEPVRYYSPGIVIKKEIVRLPIDAETLASASPEQLAQLAPAAGESTAGVDAPLIPAPPPSGAPPAPTPPAVQPAATPELTPLVAPAAAPAQPASPAQITTPQTPEDIAKVKELVETLPDESGQSVPDDTLPSLEAPAKSESTPEPKTPIAAPAPQPAVKATASAPDATQEQPSDLSPKSKQILQKLPAMADEKPTEPKGAEIDRSKETTNIFDAEVQDATHESAGVKIEVKAPSMNIEYELEKAYNALLSGQSTAAIGIYKDVLLNDPTNEDALFGLATTYHRAGQIEAARPLYGKILAQNPTHRAALNNFLVMVADEAPQEALMQLEALENKSPSFSPIPAQMAVIYQKLGDLPKATEKMFKAVSLAPENLTYRYNLAILMDKQRNYEEAVKLYGQITQAHARGEITPGNINTIQERLTFLRSNKR